MKRPGSEQASETPIRLAVSPAPAHVRSVRLVAVAVARHVGVAEDLIDEIRLAMGEACARAVAAHQQAGITDLVEIEFGVISHPRRLEVSVRDHSSVAPLPVAAEQAMELLDTDHDDEVGLAVLAGLVDDVEVVRASDGPGTVVRMRWAIS